MRTLSNKKVAWLVALLCTVPMCRVMADTSAAAAVLSRADRPGHESGQVHRSVLNPGAAKSASSIGQYPARSGTSRGFNASTSKIRPDLEADTAHAGLGNLNWVSRRKSLEETARRFHQEGFPLARLWQSNSCALSLGINPDKKPGLWFVKRLP